MTMERAAFAHLLEEHKDAVFGMAVNLLGQREDAEEVVQEVFLKLWRQGDQVQELARPAWLMRVGRNACLDRLRRRKVRRHHRADPSQTVTGVGLLEELEAASGREASFDLSDEGVGAQAMEEQVQLQRVVAAMRELKEPQRSVILLRELQDMAYEDIASTLEISLSSVKVTLHRARKKLRQTLSQPEEASA